MLNTYSRVRGAPVPARQPASWFRLQLWLPALSIKASLGTVHLVKEPVFNCLQYLNTVW